VLKFIRRNASAFWVKVLFGLIAAAFVIGLGLGGGMASGRKEDVVVRVNEETIDSLDFRRAHDNLYRLYESIYKDNFKPELARMLDLKNKAVDQLVRVALLRQEGERLGLRASDAEIRNAIAAIKGFHTESGGFDKDLYVRILRANRLTPSEFEASQGDEILVNKVQEVITAAVHVTEAEARDRYRFDNDKVSLKFLKFEALALTDEVQLTDDDIQKHYDANQEKFREAEKVRVEYVHFAPEKLAAQIQVTDTDLQTYYDGHKSEYEMPEQVSARHILLKLDSTATDEAKAEVRKKADELLAKAKGGEDFAALAQASSQDEGSATKGGDLGAFGRGSMVPPFEEAAFALNPGEISSIVESQFGLHIIKLESKTAAHTQSLDEVRSAVTDKVRTEKSRALARDQAYAAHGKVEAGEALTAAVAGSSFSVEAPEPFAQSDAPAGIGRGPVVNAAFATEAGKAGPVVEAPVGFYVFLVKEKIASRIPPLTEIRANVEKALRVLKAEDVAKTKAEAALAELQKSGDIEAVGKAFHVEAEETSDLTRQGTYVGKIGSSPELKKAAFKLTPEQPIAPAVYNVSGSSVIVTLKQKTAADEEKFESEKENLIRQVEDRRKNQALEEFVNYLKARATIEINQEFLAAVPDSGRMLGSPLRGGE